MRIEWVGEKIKISQKCLIKKCVKATLKELEQITNIVICVNCVDSHEMRELNNRMRGIDKVTDVLSFPSETLVPFEKVTLNSSESRDLIFGGNLFLGDMALCMDEIKRQAVEYGETENKVLARLVIHSVLHLLGFDHIKDEDHEVMEPIQNKILSKIVK